MIHGPRPRNEAPASAATAVEYSPPMTSQSDDLLVSWSDLADRISFQPGTCKVWWRDLAQLQKICELCGFEPEIQKVFIDAARRIESHGPQWWQWLSLAEQLYRSTDDELRAAAITRAGPDENRWGELARLFPALVCLTALPKMIEQHQTLGIPAQYMRDTASDLPRRMKGYHSKYGTWGTDDNVGWFTKHLRLKLIALGRLQFEFAPYHQAFVVLKDHHGKIVPLVEADRVIRADGHFACADHGVALHAADNWRSRFIETSNHFEGHVVDEMGRVNSQLTTFEKSRWSVALRRGDDALSVHIPAGAPLEPQACLESFAAASTFFPQYFPAFSPKGYYCISWMMDPQLVTLLGPQSNLSQFINLFHIVPAGRANDDQLFERVFGGRFELDSAPRNTTLQRRVLDFMQTGGRLRSACGIRLFDQR